MRLHRFPGRMAIGLVAVFLVACGRSSPTTTHAPPPQNGPQGITRIDPKDTAAYSEAGAEAVAAIARCAPPRCRPDIFRGPGPGELTVGLDSGTSAEFQWHLMADTTTPAGEAQQDSAWITMLSTWESSTPARLLIIDGTPRSYAYAREHLRLSSVWGMREVSAKEAKALTSDSAAANGAVVIVTKAHAPAAR